MKIRGYKTIVKFFTHEVSDLEPTFYFMVSQDPQDYSGWETRYVLLIWLSLICMIPFDLKTVDSLAVAEGNK
ncbi:7830_t:CDS:2, partial [Scutellospora calospora]